MIEYHKIQKSVGNQTERGGVRKSQKFLSFYNKVAASSRNTKDHSRIILALTDKISHSSFSFMFHPTF